MTRTLTLTLSPGTADALTNANQVLYVAKAIKYGFSGVVFPPQPRGRTPSAGPPPAPKGYGGGAPLVWQLQARLLDTMRISWDAAVNAYISSDPIVDQKPVSVGSSAPTDLGQVVNVSNSGGLTTATGGGVGAVSLVNQGGQTWPACGLAEGLAASLVPSSAFPLYPGLTVVLRPQDLVFVMFASDLLAVGDVIQTAYSAGLLVDAAGGDRAIGYDIAKGWSAGGQTWATPVAALADLSDLLITTA